MFDRFTRGARDAMVSAQAQARSLGHREIAPEHLLLGLFADGTGTAARVLADAGVTPESLAREIAHLGAADADALRTIGVDLDAVRQQVEASFGPGALDQPRGRRRRGLLGGRLTGDSLPFGPAAKRAVEQSLAESRALGHDHLGTEHVLLALLAADGGPVTPTLRRLGVEPAALRSRLLEDLRRAA